MKYGTSAARATAGKKGILLLLAFIMSAMIALPACTSSDEGAGDAAGTEQQAAAIEATVAVAANEEAGIAAQEAPVSLAEGATAYDALETCGIDFVASDSEYGKFVESVAGVAGTDSTGWVYTVNGESPTVGCDAYVLAPGDVVEWSLISW